MQPEKIKAQALVGIARDIGAQRSGRSALIIDLSGVPAVRNRILFRAFVRFIEEHSLDHAIRVQPLAMNVVVVIVHGDPDQVIERLVKLDLFLIEQRHGTIKLSCFNLDTEAERFVMHCTRLMEQAPLPPADRSIPTILTAPPDIAHLDDLIDIERVIGQADLSLQIRSQTIWRLEQDRPPAAFAEELWVSVPAIEQITGHAIYDDSWIFGRSTELFDNRVLSYLQKERSTKPIRRFLNLNPASIVGSDFRRLLATLPADQVRKLTVELALLNWRADPVAGRKIAGLLRRNGISLALDGIRAIDIAELTDEESRAADFLKVDAVAQPADALRTGLANLKSEAIPKAVLCHCETTEQIAAGLSAGLRYYQGYGLSAFLGDPQQIEPLLGREAAMTAAGAVKTVAAAGAHRSL